jgi:hypothetical protein
LKAEHGEWIEEEKRVQEEWLRLSEQEAAFKKKLKEAEAELDALAYAKYPELTEGLRYPDFNGHSRLVN